MSDADEGFRPPAPAESARPSSEAANRAYYRAVEGRWSAPLELVITDWRAFRRAPLALGDRLRLWSLLVVTRLIGPCRLETSVDASGDAARDEVVHTTRVSKCGMTLMRSIERIALAANGRDATMGVEMRLAPAWWRTRVEPAAPVRIDEAGRRASYCLAWLGTEMRQVAERSPDGAVVTVTQDTDFSRGVQVLRRRGGP